VQPLLDEAAKAYAEKNAGWPARTEPCDKPVRPSLPPSGRRACPRAKTRDGATPGLDPGLDPGGRMRDPAAPKGVRKNARLSIGHGAAFSRASAASSMNMRKRPDTRYVTINHNPITMASMDRLFRVTNAARARSSRSSLRKRNDSPRLGSATYPFASRCYPRCSR
jgi:hypothetical protein